jgi:hypothetical protein
MKQGPFSNYQSQLVDYLQSSPAELAQNRENLVDLDPANLDRIEAYRESFWTRTISELGRVVFERLANLMTPEACQQLLYAYFQERGFRHRDLATALDQLLDFVQEQPIDSLQKYIWLLIKSALVERDLLIGPDPSPCPQANLTLEQMHLSRESALICSSWPMDCYKIWNDCQIPLRLDDSLMMCWQETSTGLFMQKTSSMDLQYVAIPQIFCPLVSDLQKGQNLKQAIESFSDSDLFEDKNLESKTLIQDLQQLIQNLAAAQAFQSRNN